MIAAIETRTCVICGNPYESGRTRQVTCGSETCKRQRELNTRNGGPPEVRQCVICGATFHGNGRRVTCGDECAAQNKKQTRAAIAARHRSKKHKPRTVECISCGATFERAKGSPAKRCLACQDANRTRQRYDIVSSAPPNDERRIDPDKPRIPKYFGNGTGGEYDFSTWFDREVKKLERAGLPRFISAEERAALYSMRETGGTNDLLG